MPRDLSLSDIFQLGYYWETKVLLTAVKLDIFSALDDKDLSTEELAQRLSTDSRALEMLLNALVALRVIAKSGTTYVNTETTQTYLVKHAPAYIGHLLLLHDSEWNHWGQLEEAVRSGRSPVQGHVFESNPALGAKVLTVLDRIGRQSGPSLVKRLDLSHDQTMLDLGGGAGTNAIAACQTYSHLSVTVFDLPQTLFLTEQVVKEANLLDRIVLRPGNFHTDSLGGPYDFILMSDVLHYQGPEANAALVQHCLEHLTPEGRLVIKDRFLDETGTGPAWVTTFAIHIFVNTEHGRCYRVPEVMAWMEQAGFQAVQELEPLAVVQGFNQS